MAELLKLQSFKRNLTQLQEKTYLRIQRPLPEDKFPKIIIFTNFTQSCTAIVKHLSATFGENAVASHSLADSLETIETNLNRFKTNSQCFLLVCDSSGEQGANFQFADGVIHFDLPFSPNRLEQRLGRLDRIGGKPEFTSWLLVGNDLPDSYQAAWFELFAQGFDIFNNSIASLQSYGEQKTQELEKIFLQSGAKGILENIEQVKAAIKQEKLKLNEEDILDEIDVQAETAKVYFEKLDEHDSKHQTIEKATEGWLCNALKFSRTNEVNVPDIRTYQRTPKTLMSVDDLKTYFGSCLQQKGVYNRRVSNQYSGVNLYRLGNPLIDTTAAYADWDDRGRAFALWRHEETWDNTEGGEWLGFRLDYLIETDLSKVQQMIEQLSLNFSNHKLLRRRGDVFFPPLLKTIFLNINLELVEDEQLISILRRSYSRSHDYNLAKERAAIMDLYIQSTPWEDLCRQAQETAEKLLSESSDFKNICQLSAENARKKLEQNLNQLKQRLKNNYQKELFKEVQLENAITEGLLEGIQKPRFVPDAVGFIIVSGRPPTKSD